MSRTDALRKARKLNAVTVERGATPAEAAAAASLARQLTSHIRYASLCPVHTTPDLSLSPGVHVDIA